MPPAAPPQPKAPPKPTPRPAAAPPAAAPTQVRQFRVGRGVREQGHRIVIYGPGGVGKTELCSLMEDVGIETLFLDLEDGTRFLDVQRADPSPETWEELRAILQSHELLAPFQAVVIDSATKAEEFSVAWTLANVKHEKGHYVHRIEDYGFGKGYQHTYDTYLCLLGDLDALARAGKHVVLVCHDCTASVPNPMGEDFLQYQPRLQSPPKTGKIRERVREWADHLFFVGWDRFVNEDGKAEGGGTRTIYCEERPTHWAKSRVLAGAFQYVQGDPALWLALFRGDNS